MNIFINERQIKLRHTLVCCFSAFGESMIALFEQPLRNPPLLVIDGSIFQSSSGFIDRVICRAVSDRRLVMIDLRKQGRSFASHFSIISGILIRKCRIFP